MTTAAPAVPAKPSALAALKALTKKPEPGAAPPVVSSLNDPAIVGAVRDKRGNTVKLGYDPNFARKARNTALLHNALEQAEADFAVFQGEARDYGLAKRGIYNTEFRTSITTVCVPYPEHVIEDDDGTFRPAPGSDMKWVQVICTNRWSVNGDMVVANRDRIGEDNFERLFKVEVTRALKPNAEELFRGLLIELGAAEEGTVDELMAQLFDSKTKVSTQEGYEAEAARLPAPIQEVLKQMVTRAQPGLKFPDT